MGFKISTIFLLLLSSAFCNTGDYSSIDLLRNDLYELGDLFRNTGRGSSPPREGTFMRLVFTYADLANRMEKSSAENSKNHLGTLESLRLWKNLNEDVGQEIEKLYKSFRSRLDNATNKMVPLNIQEWADISSNLVKNSDISIPPMLERISDAIVHGQLFMSAQEATKQICHEQQSPQELLYNLYNTIALMEMKGYAMMQFSYTFLQLYNNGSFDEEMKMTTTKYRDRMSQTLNAVKVAMTYAPRELWKCDPSFHKEDSTYTELKQLLQGYIVNEVDLNEERTCRQNCGFYENANVYGCYIDRDCKQQRRCNGKVINCHYIDSDMWICPSARSSPRRYEYIEYENGKVYGTKGTCRNSVTKVDSWWRWLFWHCSYCMCYCDDNNSSSHRYFSLKDVIADIERNKVITGIRFQKVNNIIHLVIQQGELMARAEIANSTIEWKKVDNFTTREGRDGRDYHTLGWKKSAIDLDDLVAPEGHVLTGVRFRKLGTHLNFEIQITPFNFTTGKLVKPLEKSTWLSNDNTDFDNKESPEKVRTELKLEKPGIPTKTSAPSLPDSRSNQFLNFGPTDFEKDAAQSTVPFIDVQPVITYPAFPLAGAGIYHKGRRGSGGFVAPRIITYNIKDHIKADLPPEKPIIGDSGLNEILFL